MTKIAQITPSRVVIGVDTHKDVHVAVALDDLGRRLDSTTIATTTAGYRALVAWGDALGTVEAFAVEGTGSYGAGLARHLRASDRHVVEVLRPNRQARRRNGKSDPVDAEAAARAVLSGEATGSPKSGDDLVEMIRVLRVARSTARKARTQAMNALKSLLVTAPPTCVSSYVASRTLNWWPLRDVCVQGVRRPPPRRTRRRYELWRAATRLSTPRSPRSTRSSRSSPLRSHPSWSRPSVSDLTQLARCSWPRAITPNVSGPRRPSPCSAAPRRSRHHRARLSGTASTAAVTAKPTPPCIGSCSSACASTHPPGPTWSGAPRRASPNPRSFAA